MKTKDNDWKWIYGRGKIIERNPDGSAKRMIGTNIDITDRKIFGKKIKESEERYKAIFENNHAIMLLIDPDSGKIIDANLSACKFYGYKKEYFSDKNFSDLNVITESELLSILQYAKTEKRNHFYFRNKLFGGEIRDTEAYSGTVSISGQTFLYAIIHDITERVRIEKQLIENEEKYRVFV